MEQRIISIHAPPRGATCVYQLAVHYYDISIHAPPRGATLLLPVHASVATFQFTPLREGRPYSALWIFRSAYFNSRPSARGDFVQKLLRILGIEFQFTPLREGRRHGQGLYRADYDFNSRPSARGDHRRRSRDGSPVLFQFTPLREGRRPS